LQEGNWHLLAGAIAFLGGMMQRLNRLWIQLDQALRQLVLLVRRTIEDETPHESPRY
jgi:hypothetical protein